MNNPIEYIISVDSDGKKLTGSNIYKLTLPGDMPSSEFWSVIVYSGLSNLIIKTDQPWPSIHSGCKNIVRNTDGSVDIWFGPDPPEDKESNWIKTIPGKGWYAVFRIYNIKEDKFFRMEPW